ncbi:hypothetical protein PN466_10315 [Roseofilum reptotaenium CS-1145]|uniref:Uncharacterized protein n=1 Tax=Roseofilum reptotaenium AO1-A TaxID=1925591 RepID=A0A1L9QUB9_9CYAN|nr:hypothetical protein [Roseofilum reptotaenium]MDB9517340.1 hypothetical protein [Roseofilum reptotaenium CS-1145]OJJ26232.1 hypothetical protein BI308_07480 [Roseofilum reptotaenium AO1-A]
MGRYINCKVNDDYKIVWKYGLGTQASEMYRISTELGIGEYHMIRYVENETGENYEYINFNISINNSPGDVLILTRDDIDKIDRQIQLLKKSDKHGDNK